MAALQLVGQTALILASLALGLKLLALWRRTGQLPELAIGLSFLLFGALGYACWLAAAVLRILGASLATLHGVALAGLVASCAGAVWMGVGNARIFRPGRRWPALVVAAAGAGTAAGCLAYALAAPGSGSFSMWASLLQCGAICAWGAGEAFAVWRALRRRARLGLADPAVAHRVGQWGLACLALVLLVALAFSARLAYGRVLPAWVHAASAALGLLAATAIWLGFFPPRALRERLARAAG